MNAWPGWYSMPKTWNPAERSTPALYPPDATPEMPTLTVWFAKVVPLGQPDVARREAALKQVPAPGHRSPGAARNQMAGHSPVETSGILASTCTYPAENENFP